MDVIEFTYNQEELFDKVALHTSYKARFVSEDDSVIDKITMTLDDKPAFEKILKKVLVDIYSQTIKLTSDVEDAFKVLDGVITLKIQDNGFYNKNILEPVKASIMDCIETGIVMRWWSLCANAQLEKEYAAKYASELFTLSSRMFQLRRKPVTDTLGTLI